MNRRATFFLSLLLFVFFTIPLFAQISINTGSISIDFNDYGATGFTPVPAAGQLDSDIWRVTGLSDGDGIFGGTHDAGDFARGIDAGGVTSGGVYAFETSAADFALGIQPTGSDWNPGTIDLKLINNTGAVLTDLSIQYEIWVLNNADRSGSFNLSYSTDDLTYIPVASVDYTSVETADVLPTWNLANRGTTLSGLNIADGALLYLRWQGADIGGSGSRDEFALDDIIISQGDSPLPVELNSFKALGDDGKVDLKWTTAAELNNQGFIIYRANASDAEYIEISSYKYNDDLIGAGTSSISHEYSYVDASVSNNHTYWYKLIDVDHNGIKKIHGPVSATPQVNYVEINKTTLPEKFALYQNFPNPFNPSTTITFDIPQQTEDVKRITLSIYNLLGQKVVELNNSFLRAGRYTLQWDGLDQQGNSVPAGIYIYSLTTDLFSQSKKMTYLK